MPRLIHSGITNLTVLFKVLLWIADTHCGRYWAPLPRLCCPPCYLPGVGFSTPVPLPTIDEEPEAKKSKNNKKKTKKRSARTPAVEPAATIEVAPVESAVDGPTVAEYAVAEAVSLESAAHVESALVVESTNVVQPAVLESTFVEPTSVESPPGFDKVFATVEATPMVQSDMVEFTSDDKSTVVGNNDSNPTIQWTLITRALVGVPTPTRYFPFIYVPTIESPTAYVKTGITNLRVLFKLLQILIPPPPPSRPRRRSKKKNKKVATCFTIKTAGFQEDTLASCTDEVAEATDPYQIASITPAKEDILTACTDEDTSLTRTKQITPTTFAENISIRTYNSLDADSATAYFEDRVSQEAIVVNIPQTQCMEHLKMKVPEVAECKPAGPSTPRAPTPQTKAVDIPLITITVPTDDDLIKQESGIWTQFPHSDWMPPNPFLLSPRYMTRATHAALEMEYEDATWCEWHQPLSYEEWQLQNQNTNLDTVAEESEDLSDEHEELVTPPSTPLCLPSVSSDEDEDSDVYYLARPVSPKLQNFEDVAWNESVTTAAPAISDTGNESDSDPFIAWSASDMSIESADALDWCPSSNDWALMDDDEVIVWPASWYTSSTLPASLRA